MSYFEDMIRKLEEIAEIKELNLKLTQTLEDTLLWVIDYSERNGTPIYNAENLSYLLGQVRTLMQKTKNFSPQFLQHQSHLTTVNMNPETDAKLPEPIKDAHESVKGLKFLKDQLTLMKTEEEINTKITELKNADLDTMVTDEVEYGLFWLEWVLGQKEHTTKIRKS